MLTFARCPHVYKYDYIYSLKRQGVLKVFEFRNAPEALLECL